MSHLVAQTWFKNYYDLVADNNIILGLADGAHVQIIDAEKKPNSILIIEISEKSWQVFDELKKKINCSLELITFKNELEIIHSGFVEKIIDSEMPILPYRPAWEENFTKYSHFFEVLTGRSHAYKMANYSFMNDENMKGVSKLIGELLK